MQAAPPTRSTIVIGGGVIGMACVIALQKRGISTTLIDPLRDPRGASWGNAGHIAVEQCAPLASRAMLRTAPKRLFSRGGALALPIRDWATWLPFAWRLTRASTPRRFAEGERALSSALALAIPAWRRLLQDARSADLLAEDGHFVVWESADTAAAGRAAWAKAPIGTARFRDADDAEMAMLTRLTGKRPAGAIRFSGSGQIADLGRLADTLAAHFRSLGGERLVATVERIAADDAAASVHLKDGRTIAADAVVVAAGAQSGALLAPLGHRVPLIAERGYHIQSARTDWPMGTPPVVFEDRSMIVTRFASGLRAASFVEFAQGNRPADPEKWRRLRDHVAALGLSFERRGSEWMGARPTLPDYLPAIGRSRHAPRICYAFGHQHLGLTLAAITGEAVAALLAHDHSPLDLTPFSLDRFER